MSAFTVWQRRQFGTRISISLITDTKGRRAQSPATARIAGRRLSTEYRYLRRKKMIIRKCDRCGDIIEDESFFGGLGSAMLEAVLDAAGSLRELAGQKNGRNIELRRVRGDASSRIDLCECCRISFRKWFEGGHDDDICEQDEQGQPEEEEYSEE